MKTILKPITFKTWEELSKAVIDGRKIFFAPKREVYQTQDMEYKKILFNGAKFGYEETPQLQLGWRDCNIKILLNNSDYKFAEEHIIPLKELVEIKPRLCLVWDDEYEKKRCCSNKRGKKKYIS